MNVNWRYTLIFIAVCLLFFTWVLRNIPDEPVLVVLFIVSYVIISIALYFLIPALTAVFLLKEREKEKLIQENKQKFARADFLKKKYRYRDLSVEGIVKEEDITKADKLILLEFLHHYTPDEARELFEK